MQNNETESLKALKLLKSVVSHGKLFHILIVRHEKKNLRVSVLNRGRQSLNLCPLVWELLQKTKNLLGSMCTYVPEKNFVKKN